MEGGGGTPDRRLDIIEAIEIRTSNALNKQEMKRALRLRGDREQVSGCTKRLRTMAEVNEHLQLSSQTKKMVQSVVFDGIEPINPFGHQEPPPPPFPSPSQHGHYDPKQGSGGYAILIAMEKLHRNGQQVLHKEDILREGKMYSAKPIETKRVWHKNSLEFGTWEANKTLVKKGLMLRNIRVGPYKDEFRLTELGRQLAGELLKGHGGDEGGAEEGPATPSPAAGAAAALRGDTATVRAAAQRRARQTRGGAAAGGAAGGRAGEGAARSAAQRQRVGQAAAVGGGLASGAAGGSSNPLQPQSPVSQVLAFGSKAARGAPHEAATAPSRPKKSLVETVMEATGADIEAVGEALYCCLYSAEDAIAFLLRNRPSAAGAAVPVGPSGSAPGPSGSPPQTPPPPTTPAEQPREQRIRRWDSSATRGVAPGGSGVPVGSDRASEKAGNLGDAHQGERSRDPPPASTPTNAPRKLAVADLFRSFSSSSDSDDAAAGPQEVVNLADDSGSESEGAGEEEVLRVLREPLTLRRSNYGKRPMAEDSPCPGGAAAAAAASSLSHHGKRRKGHRLEPEDSVIIDLCGDHGHPPSRASSREPESTQQVIDEPESTQQVIDLT